MAHSRIDDLRRRVEADPASIAFAQLAEEYRRAGQTEEAVRVSREGLTRHPGYLSARVTLGRALLDLGQLDEARLELQFVATEAPENLAAVRGLAEIFHREGDATSALEYFQRALSLARHDPELEEIVQQLSRQAGAEAGPSTGLTFEEAHQELLSAADRVPLAPIAEPTEAPAEQGGETAPFDFDKLVAALGTPAAPPVVESIVRGETPAVFELPDMPASGDDPFAALEAELRSQEASATPIADEVAALAGEIEASEAAAAPESPRPVLIDDGGEPSDPLPPAAASAPWAPHEGVADDVFEPAEAEPDAVPWSPDWLAERADPSAADEPPPATPSWPTVDVEAGLSPTAEETTMERSRGDADATEAGPPDATEAPDQPADPAPTARSQRDDVLNDLEDWLNTLQDRSSQ